MRRVSATKAGMSLIEARRPVRALQASSRSCQEARRNRNEADDEGDGERRGTGIDSGEAQGRISGSGLSAMACMVVVSVTRLATRIMSRMRVVEATAARPGFEPGLQRADQDEEREERLQDGKARHGLPPQGGIDEEREAERGEERERIRDRQDRQARGGRRASFAPVGTRWSHVGWAR